MFICTPQILDKIEDATRRAVEVRASHIDELDEHVKTPHRELDVFLGEIPGKDMLDIGCGQARYANRFIEAGMNYIGIDLSPSLVEIARVRNPKLRFETMSFRKLAFPNESFDGLWCCCSLMHEPKFNVPNVLGEMQRVLRPGGIVHIVVPNYGSTGETLAPIEGGGDILTHVSLWELGSYDLSSNELTSAYSTRSTGSNISRSVLRRKNDRPGGNRLGRFLFNHSSSAITKFVL